jgi:hypothetical protein
MKGRLNFEVRVRGQWREPTDAQWEVTAIRIARAARGRSRQRFVAVFADNICVTVDENGGTQIRKGRQ